MNKEISLIEFKSEISKISGLNVDLNRLMGVCGVSPIKVSYITNDITVFTTYPECVIMKSGKSSISISQINKIIKVENGYDYGYIIFCGRLNDLKMELRVITHK